MGQLLTGSAINSLASLIARSFSNEEFNHILIKFNSDYDISYYIAIGMSTEMTGGFYLNDINEGTTIPDSFCNLMSYMIISTPPEIQKQLIDILLSERGFEYRNGILTWEDKTRWETRYPGTPFQEGGYGQVYSVIDQPLVVKVLRKDSAANDRRRFIREIKILLELADCENVIEIVDYSIEADLPWFVMPKATMNLATYVEENGPLTEEECYRITIEVLNALKVAHDKDIIHRDLAASNILLFINDDGTYRVLVADFSLGRDFTRVMSKQLTRSDSRFLGQDAFVDPDQLNDLSTSGTHSDIYAIGSLMLYMLTNRDPRLANYQGIFSRFINRLRNKNKAARPQTVDHVIQGLNDCMDPVKQVVHYPLQTIVNNYHSRRGNVSGRFLTDDELESLTRHLTRRKELVKGTNMGGVNYTQYFSPIVEIPTTMIMEWVERTDIEVVNDFLDHYWEQTENIIMQTNWTFKNMLKICSVMRCIFWATQNNDTKVNILKYLAIINESGYSSEVKSTLEGIIKDKYEDSYLIEELGRVLGEHRDTLRKIYTNISSEVHHMAFIEKFDG
ncbi:serine/threonine-protein kinase [Brevibacillus sp. NPDC003359]|uniref:serine/threonine-protein kinase n=1 Tax=unclassified Brevibacillus TaxID=2684853 RepID=UPI0036B26B7A